MRVIAIVRLQMRQNENSGQPIRTSKGVGKFKFRRRFDLWDPTVGSSGQRMFEPGVRQKACSDAHARTRVPRTDTHISKNGSQLDSQRIITEVQASLSIAHKLYTRAPCTHWRYWGGLSGIQKKMSFGGKTMARVIDDGTRVRHSKLWIPSSNQRKIKCEVGVWSAEIKGRIRGGNKRQGSNTRDYRISFRITQNGRQGEVCI